MNQDPVHFSVVIPTFNRVEFLQQALASALKQTDFDDFEVLVVDDCSEDETWTYLQSVECPRLRILRNDRRLGMGLNWKKAIELSNGRFIYLLQDDDIALPQLLSVSSSLFDRYKGAELLCFATCLIDQAGENAEMYWRPERETVLRAPEALPLFAGHWTISSSQVVFSREVYDRHGGFDITAPILSDADAILRWMIDADTVLYPDPLALRRSWPGSVTAKTRHSPAMAATMKFLVRNVLQHATASKMFTDSQLSTLKSSLEITFVSA
jgi:glycosyltransferase involved in cell wall biosynthesis